MSVDQTKLQMSSTASSNRVLKEGSGSFTIPVLTGAGSTSGTDTVAHNYDSDNLIFQVTADGTSIDPAILPWESNDGRVMLYASIDDTNLTVTGFHTDSSGFGDPGRTINYYYRILIP